MRWGVAQPSSSDQRSARPGVLTVARTLRPAGTSPAVRGSLPEMHLRTRVLPLGMGATATLHAIITSSGSAGHPEVNLSAQARRAPSQSAEGSRRGRFEKGKADQDLCGRSAAPARRQGPSRRRTIPGGVTPAAAPGNGVARGKSPFHVSFHAPMWERPRRLVPRGSRGRSREGAGGVQLSAGVSAVARLRSSASSRPMRMRARFFRRFALRGLVSDSWRLRTFQTA